MKAPEEPMVSELRAAMDQVHELSAPRVSQTPPWEAVHGWTRRPRRWQRHRVSLAVGATAVAAAGLITLQIRTFGPAPQTGDRPTASETASEAVQVSTTLDDAWLDELRSWAAVSENILWTPGWTLDENAPPDGKVSEVVFAGDVGDFRIAVIEGSWESINNGAKMRFQLYGARGAAADAMTPGDVAPRVNLPFVMGLSAYNAFRDLPEERSRALRGVGVVLSDQPVEVSLQEPPTIAADGSVTAHERPVEGKNGVYEVVADQPGYHVLLTSDGRRQEFMGEFQVRDPSSIEPRPSRGGQLIAVDLAEEPYGRGIVLQATLAARQAPGEGRWQTLALEDGGTNISAPLRALVGVLTLPSGARVLAAGHVGVEYDPSTESVRPPTELDIAELLPAGDDDANSIAWKIAAKQEWVNEENPDKPGSSGYRKDLAPARTAALGPEGTTSVEWTAGGETFSTPAENTLAVTDRVDVTSARFLDGGGQELGTAEVRAAEASEYFTFDNKNQPTPMEWHSPWLLPEVRQGLTGF